MCNEITSAQKPISVLLKMMSQAKIAFSAHLECPQSLVHTPSDGQVVDGGVLDDSLGVDDVQTPQSSTLQTARRVS
jgi:hypothetical protein